MTQGEESQVTEVEATVTEEVVEKPKESLEPKQPVNEIKILITLKDDSILLGVQSPDCDPVFKTFKGTMAVALKQVPVLVKEAKEKWAAAPLNPKADLPEPPPSQAPARTPPTPKPTKPTAQPSFF